MVVVEVEDKFHSGSDRVKVWAIQALILARFIILALNYPSVPTAQCTVHRLASCGKEV
jgi:hypothetical protein